MAIQQILLGMGGVADEFIEASGGTVTTDGDWKVHTFTGSGTFSVTQVANSTPNAPNNVYYMVIAGAGGGGSHVGGGGGAGGLATNHPDCPGSGNIPRRPEASGGLP